MWSIDQSQRRSNPTGHHGHVRQRTQYRDRHKENTGAIVWRVKRYLVSDWRCHHSGKIPSTAKIKLGVCIVSDNWLEPNEVGAIVVHCSASLPDPNIDVETIRGWHVDPPPQGNAWSDIGYNFVIPVSGEIQVGRPLHRTGAHAIRWNDESVSVCLVGGVDENGNAKNNFTSEQLFALRRLINSLQRIFPKAALCGHRDLDSEHQRLKECPSFDVRTWYLEVDGVL